MPESTPVQVAVVGHTNTGKTSLLRTLLRDVSFGEVADRPAVTRVVERAILHARDGGAMESLIPLGSKTPSASLKRWTRNAIDNATITMRCAHSSMRKQQAGDLLRKRRGCARC